MDISTGTRDGALGPPTRPDRLPSWPRSLRNSLTESGLGISERGFHVSCIMHGLQSSANMSELVLRLPEHPIRGPVCGDREDPNEPIAPRPDAAPSPARGRLRHAFPAAGGARTRFRTLGHA